MKMKCLAFALALATLAVANDARAANCPTRSDILVRSDPTLAPVRPADCSTVTQSPPEFTWPPQSGKVAYELELTLPGGQKETRKTNRNWVLWDKPLPPGKYAWRVKVSGPSAYTSDARTFTIAPNPVSFVVPPGDALVKRASTTPRPRTWSQDPTRPLAAIRSERAAGFRSLREEVDNKVPSPVQPEPVATSDNANYEDTVAEQKRTLAAAFAWAATKNPRYGHDAARRMLAQAKWNVNGPISYKKNDMANRNVAWTLALAYDWTHDYLKPAQREEILAAIKARTQPMYEDVVNRLAGYPYDSHANLTLSIVAAIGTLTVGEIPEAEAWVRDAVPLAVVWTSPWGLQDGGFANGTAQLFWDTGSHLPAWYILRNAAGVDLSKKEWVRNHLRFMAYFVPPGAPSGVFGDGHELNLAEVWARVSKAVARFAPSSLGLWYAGSMGREDAARIELMLSPRVKEKEDADLPRETPNSAFFPSVGWVAMHSDLEDPQRTSVYFKSSPYGSYNHGHGDQNGFVIHHRGERLLVNSGYYDGYQTEHWRNWYKQTRAANAITFDGGKGQGFNGKQFSGEVTRFESGPGWDLAVGRAEKAYGGELTRAQRSIVFLRPNLVLIHDSLASETPRAWEWNLHALEKMRPASDKVVHVRNGNAKMCVEMLVSPEVSFRQTDQFTAPPSGKDMPNQWHGTFVSATKSPRAEFVALMRIGADCKPGGMRSAMVAPTPDGLRVELEGYSVSFGANGPAVTAKPGTTLAERSSPQRPPGPQS
ncbi:MAG TPA: DUF4962 domain-containing protein [Usitatibacter sp.]|nr:DUF4962 domain-containing protein [Usitatibacter sp.]